MGEKGSLRGGQKRGKNQRGQEEKNEFIIDAGHHESDVYFKGEAVNDYLCANDDGMRRQE